MPRTYNHDALYDAYLAVTEDKLSVRAAAHRFGVPRRTLGDRLNKTTPLDCLASGPPPLPTDVQELALYKHLVKMADFGYGYSRREVIDLASGFAVSEGLRPKSKPLGKNWYRGFMGRWPDLKLKRTSSLDTYRAKASKQKNVAEYFERLKDTMSNHDVMDKPAHIYNIDEKGLTPHYQPPRIATRRKGLSQTVTPPRGTITTIIGCGNAMGTRIPPYFVFKGSRMQSTYLGKASVGSSGCVSESGWSNSIIFKNYLQDHFLKYAQRSSPSHPLLIIYDGHKSHVTLDVLDWAKRHNIVLFVLPAHTSHFLQPLDVGCFGPLEGMFIRMKHEAVREHASGNLDLESIAEIGSKAYEESMKCSNLTAGFKKTGIYPFEGMKAVDPMRLLPATAFCAEEEEEKQRREQKETEDDGEIEFEFFKEKERKLQVKRGETRKRKVLGAIASGKEITDKAVERDVRDHIKRSHEGKKARMEPFDPDRDCCVCERSDPPLEGEGNVEWFGCDWCNHWVHIELCVPVTASGSRDEFLCPCCRSKAEQ